MALVVILVILARVGTLASAVIWELVATRVIRAIAEVESVDIRVIQAQVVIQAIQASAVIQAIVGVASVGILDIPVLALVATQVILE